MSRFTVRVELSNSITADYSALHASMEMEGFTRTISTDTGATYQLPNAEYSFSSSTMNRSQVGQLAKSTADSIQRNSKILVTESAGRWWSGLDNA